MVKDNGNSESAKSDDLGIYTYANYKRRFVTNSVVVSVALCIAVISFWWIISAVLDSTLFLHIKSDMVVSVKSNIDSYEEFLADLYFDERLPVDVRKECEEFLREASTSVIAGVTDEYRSFVLVVVRCLVFFCVMIVCLVYGFYIKNNPDTMISSMGTLSKQVLQAGITEDLRREKMAASIYKRRSVRREKRQEEHREWQTSVKKRKVEASLKKKET